MVLIMSFTVSPAFAKDAYESLDFGGPKGSTDDQNKKESEMLINNCAKYVDRIHQRIQILQTEIKQKHVGTSVRDELKKLEQNLQEAYYIARALEIF